MKRGLGRLRMKKIRQLEYDSIDRQREEVEVEEKGRKKAEAKMKEVAPKAIRIEKLLPLERLHHFPRAEHFFGRGSYDPRPRAEPTTQLQSLQAAASVCFGRRFG
ncbi:hypothetical protein L218DRAFT_1008978 [Marasmius fiardii PR-910]|nr:hypothetical protein L218DRAFT_1008978 [Marasmius fiardii PR-910]